MLLRVDPEPSPAEHEKSGADIASHSTLLYLMNPGGKLDVLVRPDTTADQLAETLRHQKKRHGKADEGKWIAMMSNMSGMMWGMGLHGSSSLSSSCWLS